MRGEAARYLFAGLCVSFFLTVQAFQALAYWLWIPSPRGTQAELLIYLLPVDRARALLVLLSIISLIVPFAVIAIRCRRLSPLTSMLGLIFGVAFIGFEVSARSIDFWVVGHSWARELATVSTDLERAALLARFTAWNEIAQGWYFPQRLMYLLASCSFAVATSRRARSWMLLAPIAFVLNALRLIGRLLSNFAQQNWLDALNNWAYFPTVAAINLMLVAWFFTLWRQAPSLRSG